MIKCVWITVTFYCDNPGTKREISDLWAAGHTEELNKRLRSRIEFGTAGLRGRMEAGWSGLCAYVLEHVDNARNRGAVIGYDHRYNSERWALLTALAFLDKGVKTYLYRDLVHTPMQVDAVWAVPFGVKKLDAACGIMITASHNPKVIQSLVCDSIRCTGRTGSRLSAHMTKAFQRPSPPIWTRRGGTQTLYSQTRYASIVPVKWSRVTPTI
ncbi:hypothetical protein BJV77DRAFT_981943 [Russula vinacea]|nr:hypothetical protein BJV77DRAFT_981943 [Russula vinacea]